MHHKITIGFREKITSFKHFFSKITKLGKFKRLMAHFCLCQMFYKILMLIFGLNAEKVLPPRRF